MPVIAHEGIYQIHWCIHSGSTILPLSLTDRASAEEASEIVEKALLGIRDPKALEQLFLDKMALSQALSWEK